MQGNGGDYEFWKGFESNLVLETFLNYVFLFQRAGTCKWSSIIIMDYVNISTFMYIRY